MEIYPCNIYDVACNIVLLSELEDIRTGTPKELKIHCLPKWMFSGKAKI
jgi:hypothetical protein